MVPKSKCKMQINKLHQVKCDIFIAVRYLEGPIQSTRSKKATRSNTPPPEYRASWCWRSYLHLHAPSMLQYIPYITLIWCWSAARCTLAYVLRQ
jgi:hypothetical protein